MSPSGPQTPTTLYRFFASDGTLLYVGITERGAMRWSEHRKGKHWWDEVASVTTEHLPTRAAALEAEARAIRTEAPAHNKTRRADAAVMDVVTDRTQCAAVVERGEAVALRTTVHDFPPVGLIVGMDDTWVRLHAYDWLGCMFTGATMVIKWEHVIEVRVADIERRDDDGWVVFDMASLAAFQSEHDIRRPPPKSAPSMNGAPE